jgi:hypothetical protein
MPSQGVPKRMTVATSSASKSCKSLPPFFKRLFCVLFRAGRGSYSVCGQYRKLRMWDDGLNGRFCSQCFDHVVDAKEWLVSQGLNPPGPEERRRRIAGIDRRNISTMFWNRIIGRSSAGWAQASIFARSGELGARSPATKRSI